MPMYNLKEYCENYSETYGSLWKYCKDIPAVNNNSEIVDFNELMLLIHLFSNQK